MANTKRQRAVESASDKAPAKRARNSANNKVLNSRPTEIIDVLVFGQGDMGELGIGFKEEVQGFKEPRLNSYLSRVNVVQATASSMSGAVLTQDGSVLTWGVNDHANLGRQTDSDAIESIPGSIDLLPKDVEITYVSMGDNTTYFLTEDGDVWGCGTYRNDSGQIGFTPSIIQQNYPIKVPELKNIIKIASGANHTIALDKNGEVWCWGAGEQGQLGRRIIDRHVKEGLIPSKALRSREIIDIVAGDHHSFALAADGDVYAWGVNNFGQCGITEGAGDEAYLNTAVKSTLLSRAKLKQIAAGSHHSIGIRHDGTVLVWGRCDVGQMGIDLDTISDVVTDNRGKPGFISRPTAVPGLRATMVEAGSDSSFAIADGSAYAWGYGESYRTGLGSTSTVNIATRMAGNKLSWIGPGAQWGMVAGKRLCRDNNPHFDDDNGQT